jgi:adenosine deaminase
MTVGARSSGPGRVLGYGLLEVPPDPLADVPKAELHVHLPGCVRPATLAELAARHDVSLPLAAVELYTRINSLPALEEAAAGPWFPLLAVYKLICRCLQDRSDFARVVYEAMEDANRFSNVVHQELAWSPSIHLALGVSYPDMVAGMAEGLRAAYSDFGMTGGFIAAVNREDSPAVALEMAETLRADPRDEVLAIGLDFDERRGPPEAFAQAFQVARQAGLHRTAHAGEHVPGQAGAANVLTCLEVLSCERIDHGYYVLEDPAVVARCRDDGVAFDVAFTTSRRALRPWRQASVLQMLNCGLRVNISSDDPELFPTTVADEFAIAREAIGLSAEMSLELVRNGITASFMEENARRRLEQRLDAVAANLSTQSLNRHGEAGEIGSHLHPSKTKAHRMLPDR